MEVNRKHTKNLLCNKKFEETIVLCVEISSYENIISFLYSLISIYSWVLYSSGSSWNRGRVEHNDSSSSLEVINSNMRSENLYAKMMDQYMKQWIHNKKNETIRNSPSKKVLPNCNYTVHMIKQHFWFVTVKSLASHNFTRPVWS